MEQPQHGCSDGKVCPECHGEELEHDAQRGGIDRECNQGRLRGQAERHGQCAAGVPVPPGDGGERQGAGRDARRGRAAPGGGGRLLQVPRRRGDPVPAGVPAGGHGHAVQPGQPHNQGAPHKLQRPVHLQAVRAVRRGQGRQGHPGGGRHVHRRRARGVHARLRRGEGHRAPGPPQAARRHPHEGLGERPPAARGHPEGARRVTRAGGSAQAAAPRTAWAGGER
mmetsp:Transcript_46956/g.132443  ORF Transcript_46956/g.132443 Transcript_46956/m.132443 type:complete len:224 (-) Transcript_46956:19-690(-)